MIASSRRILGLTVGLLLWNFLPARGQQAEPEAPQQAVRASEKVTVQTPVPRLVKFSGALKDSVAVGADPGVHTTTPRIVGVTFAIYAEQDGGSPLWMETHNVTLDAEGRYSVLLGATKAQGIPLELFSTGETRWLGIEPVDAVGVGARHAVPLLVSCISSKSKEPVFFCKPVHPVLLRDFLSW